MTQQEKEKKAIFKNKTGAEISKGVVSYMRKYFAEIKTAAAQIETPLNPVEVFGSPL